MNLENFLPDSQWSMDLRAAAKDPKNLVALGALGVVLGPLSLGLPFFQYTIVGYLISIYLKNQRKKKISAILEAMPGKYREDELERIAAEQPAELNRLFRLASDEFFRKYIKEQENHRKAQELIVQMQARIDSMRGRMAELQRKAEKHEKEIRELQEELSSYEAILSNWQNASKAA